MIIKTKTETRIEGDITTVATDLTVIINTLKGIMVDADIPEEEVKRLIEKAVEIAFKPEEELRKEAEELLKKRLSENKEDFFKSLKEALFGEEEEDDE